VAVILRDARAGDAAGICVIWNAVITGSAATFTDQTKTEAVISAMIAERQRSGFGFLVAEKDGQVLGFATWAQFRAGPGYVGCLEHSILVQDGLQGRGVGRVLMDALCARAQSQGHRMLIAAISGANPAGVAFHAALGFGQVGRIPAAGVKFGEVHDLILMQKML